MYGPRGLRPAGSMRPSTLSTSHPRWRNCSAFRAVLVRGQTFAAAKDLRRRADALRSSAELRPVKRDALRIRRPTHGPWTRRNSRVSAIALKRGRFEDRVSPDDFLRFGERAVGGWSACHGASGRARPPSWVAAGGAHQAPVAGHFFMSLPCRS